MDRPYGLMPPRHDVRDTTMLTQSGRQVLQAGQDTIAHAQNVTYLTELFVNYAI